MEGATETQDDKTILTSNTGGGVDFLFAARMTASSALTGQSEQSFTVVAETPLLLTGRRVAGVGGGLAGAVEVAAGP